MAGCLSFAIDSSDDYAAETRNAVYPSMSALTMVSEVNEIDPFLTNSLQELILQNFNFKRLHKHQNTNLCLNNSSYPARPHLIIVYYTL